MEIKGSPEYLPSLGRQLGFAAGATNVLSQKLLDEYDLSITHWIILTALWRKDGLTIGDVAQYYQVNVPAASRTLDRMEEAGLVERRADPESRRVVRVWLTEKGKGLSDLLDFYKDVNARLLRGFSKDEARQLGEFLDRVHQNATRAITEIDD